MQSDKRHLTDEMDLLNQDNIRTFREKETYKYLGILEADTIKQEEMKKKIIKEYLRRTRKPFKIKLQSRNLIKESVDALIQRLEDYLQKHGGRLITAARNNTNNPRNNRTTITRK